MVGRAALIARRVAAWRGGGRWRRRRSRARRRSRRWRLHLRGIDLVHRLIMIEVDGMPKAPPSNYFTMTDDRGHHYIAQTIHCDPPFPSGTRSCELEIPAGYERHPLQALELHMGGLHGRPIARRAEGGQGGVGRRPSRRTRRRRASRRRRRGPPLDAGVLDSGVPRTDAGR